jgi:hypothetical protein
MPAAIRNEADLIRYHFSGAKSAVNSISQTRQYANQVTEKVKQKAPEPNQALQWLRETAQAYAGLIPGARGYVDKALDDFDRIYEKHGSEVDRLISETHEELRQVANEKGASVEGMYAAWSVLERRIREIGSLASDAADEVISNHPELQEKLGGSLQTLRSMGENYGSEAKDQVNKTFDEVRQILSQGTSAQSVQKAQQVLEERTRTLKEYGQQAWERGWQRAQPYLEKSPKAKQLIEENEDSLKQGNLSHLWAQVQNAASTGSTKQLEDFIQRTKEQVTGHGDTGSGGSSSGSQSLQSLLGGSEVLSKMQTLTELAQKNGKEAEQLLKSTVDELVDVLKRKTQEAEKIATKSRE